MTEENRSASLDGSAQSSAIITGDRNTATITITNYYYREQTTVLPVESTEAADDNLPCPYRGLFHFGPDDAEFFFGREVFIEELFKATQNRNFIPLLGASGSGKSSVVLAGLVPKLQQSGNWLFTHFRPGSDPFHALALALVPLYRQKLDSTDKITQARKLSKSLANGEIPLGDVFAQIHQNNPTHRVLLIADQFEEIYTLCADNKVRRSFLDTLLASFPSSSAQSQYNHVLVATMRADFLANALLYRPFGDVLKNDIKLSSMNHDELTSVISKPAEKLQVTFQSGLVERILDDVEKEPGNLPLLEFALTQLWKQRQGKQLTHTAYQAIGKVQGALARHADWNYRNYSAREKEQVRRIFIQLVQPGEGTQDTRRLATKAELGETSWDLVKHLADNRLVVTNQNAAKQQTIEVVHEALISNWDELRRWMNENRSFRAWQERLRLDMEQWQNNQGDKELLLRGKVLAEAEKQLKERRGELSADEQKFIQASVALRQNRKRLIYSGLGVVGSIFLIWMGFLGWRDYTPTGQLTHIRWKLTDASENTENSHYQSKAAIAFSKDQSFDRAFNFLDKIESSYNKAHALRDIAQVFAKLSQPEKAASLLQQAIKSADKIESSRHKASALGDIAEVIAKLSQPEKAASLLQQAIKSADKIESSLYKASALRDIAQVIAKLSQPEKAASLLQQGIKSAEKIESSLHKASALGDIAEVFAKLSQPEKAASLLQQAIKSADKIESSPQKASALRAIAEVFAKLSQPEKAASLLQQAIKSADKIESSLHKASALRDIAQVIAKLSQPEKAASLLQQGIKSAEKIESSL
ncbi:MAG: tetratricopeptide repeat protein, partial [Cyanobacteria bacterium P01_A01_bin.68]